MRVGPHYNQALHTVLNFESALQFNVLFMNNLEMSLNIIVYYLTWTPVIS